MPVKYLWSPPQIWEYQEFTVRSGIPTGREYEPQDPHCCCGAATPWHPSEPNIINIPPAAATSSPPPPQSTGACSRSRAAAARPLPAAGAKLRRWSLLRWHLRGPPVPHRYILYVNADMPKTSAFQLCYGSVSSVISKTTIVYSVGINTSAYCKYIC